MGVREMVRQKLWRSILKGDSRRLLEVERGNVSQKVEDIYQSDCILQLAV
jgi:hypothetical protein